MYKNKKLQLSIASALCVAVFAPPAMAELQWNGFISAGGGFASPDGDASGLAGYEEDMTFDNETVLGLQLKNQINDKLSATGQIVARGTQNMDAEMAWAYLSYEANDQLTTRIGRFRTPFYLYSDFLEVGYAYHWIAPPTDVYSLPADSIDGVDLVYTQALGASDLALQFYAGSIDNSFSQSGTEIDTKIRSQAGLALTWNWDWLTLRVSRHEADKVSFNGLEDVYIDDALGGDGDVAALQAALDSYASTTGDPGFTEASNNLSVQDVKFTFTEFATKIEWNKLLLVAEMTTLEAESGPLGQQNRSYISAGYTFGPVMIHLTQAKSEDDRADIANSITPIDATSGLLKFAVDGLAQNFVTEERTTNTIGLRWDFSPGAAFKVESSDIDEKDGPSGKLYRFVVDSVF